MKRRKVVLLLICIFLLSGCWDKKELNEVAVVIGVGIDKVNDKEGVYEITAQVIKPESQTDKSGSELPTWSVSAKGRTIMSAIRNLNQLSPRRLYWAHLQVIIFGEELAKEGVSPVITWFERDRDSRAGSYVVVTQGTAKDLLNQKIELGDVPSKSMAELLDTSEARQITVRKVKLRDFMTILAKPGIDASLDVINPEEIRGKVESYQTEGVAVFKGDKLIDYINGPEVVGTELVKSNYTSAILEGKCPGDKKDYFAFQITDFNSKGRPFLNNDKLTYKIDIFLEGNLSDQTCPTNLLEHEKMQQVEKQISKVISSFIKKEFEQAKEMGSDIYGIGQEMRRYYPDAWKRQGKQPDHLLEKVTFDITVKSNVRRTGLVIEPTHTKIK